MTRAQETALPVRYSLPWACVTHSFSTESLFGHLTGLGNSALPCAEAQDHPLCACLPGQLLQEVQKVEAIILVFKKVTD